MDRRMRQRLQRSGGGACDAAAHSSVAPWWWVACVAARPQEQNANVAAQLRKAHLDAKLWGRREKRAKDKREGKKKEKKDDGTPQLPRRLLCCS